MILTSYPPAAPLDSDDIVVVARDAIVERANQAAMQSWLTSTAWANLTLQNSWVDFGVSWGTAQYRRLGDRVYTRGLLKSGNNNPMFTLPVGFRPFQNVMLTTLSANTPIRINLETNGECTRSGAETAGTLLNSWVPINFDFSTRP